VNTRTTGISGKVALVTGAAQGIGEAVVRELAALGAHVAAVDINSGKIEALACQLTRAGQCVAAYPADVRDHGAADATVNAVERGVGPISVLVNVAGILRTGPIVDITDEEWAAVFAVNTNGVFHFCRAAARRMLARKEGSIITVASNSTGVPRMHMAAYSASKAATAMFTKCLGLELADSGIRCNIVSPGSTDTAMQRAMWTDDSGAQSVIAGSLDAYRTGIPLGRLAAPADVADAVAFLASDQAAHITMHDLFVDGGAALCG
jgi:2,3-dihydro-2,3-dihydroxybenzoate dehydrogenase